LIRPEWLLNAFGVVLTAHALVYSAYLLHECAHGALFASQATNDRLGVVLAWMNGACFASYRGCKEKHLRHHADRMDVVTFDYRAILRGWPLWLRRLVLTLEWAYIPAVDYIMRGMVVAAPFLYESKRQERPRVLAVLAVRLALLALLAAISLKALVLYGLAFILFLHVLRFMDAFQHTFDVYVTLGLEPAPMEMRRDRQYEHENTYSNLVARTPWLNLAVLNFSYHNAHHARPWVPWYALPALHEQLYGTDDAQVMPCSSLVWSYHRYRVSRVLADDYGHVAADGDRAGQFQGAVGVSFLTAV
jgi:fatty acid desaturase